VAPPTHPLRRCTDSFDLDLDLRDGATDGTGVIDLSARMRPVGGRRSSRQTHTRLLAALARIQANSIAANHSAITAAQLVAVDQIPLACGSDG
jgi:hypothetical protein